MVDSFYWNSIGYWIPTHRNLLLAHFLIRPILYPKFHLMKYQSLVVGVSIQSQSKKKYLKQKEKEKKQSSLEISSSTDGSSRSRRRRNKRERHTHVFIVEVHILKELASERIWTSWPSSLRRTILLFQNLQKDGSASKELVGSSMHWVHG